MLSVHEGFLAEVKSNKWVYKGMQFQRLPLIHQTAFQEYFLTELALIQMLICASQRPSQSFDILIENFGTDSWMEIL